jgi:hypothetical protein
LAATRRTIERNVDDGETPATCLNRSARLPGRCVLIDLVRRPPFSKQCADGYYRLCCIRRLWIGQGGPVRLSSRRHRLSPSRSAFAGFRSPVAVITVAVRWCLRRGRPTATWKGYWPNAVCRSITSPSTGGCSDARHWSPTRPDSPGTRRVIGGSSTKPTSKSTASSAMCTGPSTNAGRSSTCSSHRVGTSLRHAGSSAGRDDLEGDTITTGMDNGVRRSQTTDRDEASAPIRRTGLGDVSVELDATDL